ncbi:hypothetical protein F4780DRAFT_737429 [Xylariomycetidae sp. FL0641]|nr:hypothetical protein F4780DRAFT_737429 [Xylariomycetidae sp. FL0641]
MIEGAHASHLCHQPACINQDHIVVESKEENEARKGCKGRIIIKTIKTIVGGVAYTLPPANQCPCAGSG